MKVINRAFENSDFKPFDLTLRFETREEAETFHNLFNIVAVGDLFDDVDHDIRRHIEINLGVNEDESFDSFDEVLDRVKKA